MKKIMYIAVAAIAALSSCSSEEFAGSNGSNGDAKVFTATIEGDGVSSRSTYDATAKKALWEATDIVSINGVKYQAQSGGAATTTFAKASGETAEAPTAPYYAFFADGANTGTGYWDGNNSFTLPPAYTGSVDESGNPKFNMPMYAYNVTGTELTFRNLCGVLAISVPSTEMASVSSIVVSSDIQMNGEFTIDNDTYALTFKSKELGQGEKKVTLNFATAVSIESGIKTFYIPVPAGSHTLKIAVYSSNKCAWMTTSSAVTINRNKKYNVAFTAKHSYTWTGDVNLGLSKTWASCNIGAKSPDDFGDYYAWGDTEPYYANGYSEIYKCTHYNGTKTGYNWTNYKWCNGSDVTLIKYNTDTSKGTVDNKTVLENNDDVAYIKTNGTYKIPTPDDFLELARNCYIEYTSNYNGTGVTGYIVYRVQQDTHKGILHTGENKWKTISSDATTFTESSEPSPTFSYSTVSDSHIFFPAAGDRYDITLQNVEGHAGFYWSSSTVSTYQPSSRELSITVADFKPYSGYARYYGLSVRGVKQ